MGVPIPFLIRIEFGYKIYNIIMNLRLTYKMLPPNMLYLVIQKPGGASHPSFFAK